MRPNPHFSAKSVIRSCIPAILYITSFLLPVLPVPDGILCYPGWLAFWRGMTGGVLFGISTAQGNPQIFCWSFFTLWAANPIFWVGIYYLARRRSLLAGGAGTVAFGVASTCLFIDQDSQLIPAGYRSYNLRHDLLLGYHVWLASMGSLACLSLVDVCSRRRAETTVKGDSKGDIVCARKEKGTS